MKKLTAVIIDDEQYAIDDLAYLIEKEGLPVEVVATAKNAFDGASLIKELSPDIVFLDIIMPGVTGFELLENVAGINFHLIIVSSVDKFAIQALRASALDFLLKPINAGELKDAVTKIIQQSSFPEKQQIQYLRDQLQTRGDLRKIAIGISDGIQFVRPEDILYFQSDGNYTHIVFRDQPKILVSKQIGKFEEMLAGQPFFRVHSSYLINLNHISRYMRSDGGFVVMENGENISVSRNRKEQFLEILGKNRV